MRIDIRFVIHDGYIRFIMNGGN